MSPESAISSQDFDLPEVMHPELYRELRTLAVRHMDSNRRNQTLQPTILVHEAWIRLAKGSGKWRDRRHFFASASVTMRHILIDHARRKARLSHSGGLRRISVSSLGELPAPDRPVAVLLLDEGISELEKTNPERARVVVDRFFGGMTNEEIAQSLGIGERSVERHWAMAKVWLHRWMERANTSGARTVA